MNVLACGFQVLQFGINDLHGFVPFLQNIRAKPLHGSIKCRLKSLRPLPPQPLAFLLETLQRLGKKTVCLLFNDSQDGISCSCSDILKCALYLLLNFFYCPFANFLGLAEQVLQARVPRFFIRFTPAHPARLTTPRTIHRFIQSRVPQGAPVQLVVLRHAHLRPLGLCDAAIGHPRRVHCQPSKQRRPKQRYLVVGHALYFPRDLLPYLLGVAFQLNRCQFFCDLVHALSNAKAFNTARTPLPATAPC